MKPLKNGTTQKIFKSNVKVLLGAGKTRKQAVAIAARKSGRNKK
jgi:hypothetical protein|tara:strand:- start:604 stop:735 length:132 start_codon:yes stop_codon:yes gene_type:complete